MENKSKELAKLLNIKPKYRGSRWDFEDLDAVKQQAQKIGWKYE